MIRTRFGAGAILPAGALDTLRRRACEAGGALLLVLAALLVAVLVSHDPGDPSLNSATDRAAGNLIGMTGAYLADALMQVFGLAAWLLVLALSAWGTQMARGRPIPRLGMRLCMLVAALFFSAIAVGALPVPVSWPLSGYAGGAIGRLALELLAGLVGRLVPGLGGGAIAAAAAVMGIGALLASFGLAWSDWAAAGRATLRAGRAAVAMARRLSAVAAAGFARTRERVEPTFGTAEAETAQPSSPAPPRLRRGLVEPRPPRPKAGRRADAQRQGTLPLGDDGYRFPDLTLLEPSPAASTGADVNRDSLEQNARLLEGVLADFGVRGEILKVRPGPVVTLYELEPAPGTKTSRVIGLADDIARSMSAVSVRVAVVPGRNVIGIELPNARRELVALREMLASEAYERGGGQLTLALGKDIGGQPVMVDLARMPHLLIAGTTGSGKSVGINTMVLSLLYRLTPDRCKFIMIDPKMLELSVYEGIPHLLAPVVTEASKAVVALKWTVREMEERYRAMSQLGVRNIAGYNARLAEAARKGETLTRRVQTGFDEDGKPVFEDQPLAGEPLPFIVVVVDEMADLMLVAGKDVEAAIQRLAQMARAAGIHLIMATQRPSVDVITGTIKANFPTRISFQVTSRIDSRTILGEQGAEHLLGQGDMLYMVGGGRITRVHGPFVSDHEVERVVEHLKAQCEPTYIESITEEEDPVDGLLAGLGADSTGDELYDQAVAIVTREGKASTSFIQRHLQIGYNRAARLIERMENEGVVSRADRVGRREVLAGSPDRAPA